jgi:predicted RNase H-like HicB family nuclease
MPTKTIKVSASFSAVVHPAEEGGYWAEVPALPGCFTQAETLAELRKNVAEAVGLYLADAPASPNAGAGQVVKGVRKEKSAAKKKG